MFNAQGSNPRAGLAARGGEYHGEFRGVSVVVPCYNEEDVFPLLAAALTELADAIDHRFGLDCELILVDDGSRDGTWRLIAEATVDDVRFRGIRLARNFGHQAALTCGYEAARGQAVACMDADLQDPPAVVLKMVSEWREGADVVLAIRSRRDGESRFKLATAAFFYWMIRKLGARHVRANCGDFRLLSRRSLEALLRLPERHRFLRGMVGWIGFNTVEISYQRQTRAAGETKYPLRKMLRFAADAIFSASSAPLRLAYWLGAGLAMVSILIVAGWLLGGAVGAWDVELSWVLAFALTTAFGSSNLLVQGILGEYIGRTFAEVQRRPLYLVAELAADPEGTPRTDFALPSGEQAGEQADDDHHRI